MKKIMTLVLLSGVFIAFSGDASVAREGLNIETLADQIFDRNDADGDGFITEDEADDRLAQNFHTIDRDGDGGLTRDEVIKHFEGMLGSTLGKDKPGGLF